MNCEQEIITIEESATTLSTDYNKALNKPKINNVEVVGEKNGEDYNLVNKDQYDQKIEEYQKTIEGLTSRLKTLEETDFLILEGVKK